MDIEEIVKRLQQLQLEQDALLKKLAVATAASKLTATAEASPRETVLRLGQEVQVLTKGTQSQKGDIALVTKITEEWVHIKILRNGTHTTRKRCNLRIHNECPKRQPGERRAE